jgi:hypothetical protein
VKEIEERTSGYSYFRYDEPELPRRYSVVPPADMWLRTLRDRRSDIETECQPLVFIPQK